MDKICIQESLIRMFNLLPHHLFPYLLIGVIQGALFTKWQTEIFDWNPELEFNTFAKTAKRGKEYLLLQDKREAYKIAPKSWVWARRIKMFLGVIVGWILLWFILEKRLNYFSKTDVKFEDIALFILALVAIAGRLSTIADSVQEWFRRG